MASRKPKVSLEGGGDDVHDRVELQAGLQLVRQLHQSSKQLDLAPLGLALAAERH